MPRLVRRQPLLQRITAGFNPWDFLLWLSEEIETRELDSHATGTQIGLVFNFLFLLARANLGPSRNADDDVFGDDSGRGWLSYLVYLLVWTGCSLSVLNAFFVFTRKRHYRLFEANIENQPGTPSAHRVRVQSSPSSNSPLRILGDLVHLDTAESRAHPDSSRDVWELAVWDPRPAALALLAFFSPLHVLIYLFALPLDPLEPRPSAAVFRCLVLQGALSATLYFVQAMNDQRQRDNALVQKEVLHEYDTKFVQPRLHPVVRDMGTQVSMDAEASTEETSNESIERGTPTTLIRRRGFYTHPNAHYLKHIDPDHASSAASATASRPSGSAVPARLLTPANRPVRHSDSFLGGGGYGSSSSSARPARQSMAAAGPVGLTPSHTTPSLMAATPVPGGGVAGTAQQTPVSSAGLPANPNFGGSMGVYSHAKSPLKKAISMNELGNVGSPRNSREQAAVEQRAAAERMQQQQQQQQRAASPVKENVRPPNSAQQSTGFYPQDMSSPPVPFNPFVRSRPNAYKYERFPSRW